MERGGERVIQAIADQRERERETLPILPSMYVVHSCRWGGEGCQRKIHAKSHCACACVYLNELRIHAHIYMHIYFVLRTHIQLIMLCAGLIVILRMYHVIGLLSSLKL
jgi:hypothetical protein